MRLLLIVASLALSACVSTEMRGFVGQDINEALMRYGAPEQVIALPDGTRAYQFRRGEGMAFVPGTVTSYGSSATITPAAAIPVEGCLLTFIAAPQGDSWTVTGIRVPQDLVC